MRITVEVKANDARLAFIDAQHMRESHDKLNDTYAVAVSLGPTDAGILVPFGLITSCRSCGVPELVKRLVQRVFGDEEAQA